MKIEIKGRTYEATRDSNGWTLRSPIVVIDKKTKEEKLSTRSTYYGQMEHVLKAIIDREAGHCADLEELRELLLSPVRTEGGEQ